MKHLILLSLLFYLASCVQGEQKVQTTVGGAVEGPGTEIVQPSQTSDPSGYPPPSPIPPELAFSGSYMTVPPQLAIPTYPFTNTTQDIYLKIIISNPNNLPYIQEWNVNGVVSPSTDTTFTIDPSSSSYPQNAVSVISSVLKDGSGNFLSALSWSFIVSAGTPYYIAFSPAPAPSSFTGSPFSASNNSTQTISVTISNPSNANFYNNWYFDGVLQNPTDQTGPSTVSLSFVPANLAPGNHVIVSQLTDNPSTSTVFNTATWSFEVTELPQFSSFTGQQPSPAPFPDIVFGSGPSSIVPLDPNTLYNPSNATWTINWELDGVVDASATFNGGPGNNNPPAYTIDGNDTNKFPVGRHSVVAIIYDNSTASPTIVDSVSWNFGMIFPSPTTLTNANPATSTQIISVTTIPLNGTSPTGGFFEGPGTLDSRGTPIITGSPNAFCLSVADGRGIGIGWAPASAGVIVQYSYSDTTPINASVLEFQKIVAPPPLCLDGTGAASPTDGVPNFSLSTLGDTFITATITDKLSLQEIATVRWNIRVEPLNTPPTLDVLAPVPSAATTTANVAQDATYTYSFTVKDQDCSPANSKLDCFDVVFTMDNPVLMGVILDGTNTYYGIGPASPLTPNCDRDFSYMGADKFSCQIIVPSNNGTGPISASGTYRVMANVLNASIWDIGSPTVTGSSFYDPIVGPTVLTWNLNVTEINNAGPNLLNQIPAGVSTPTNPFFESYVYSPGTPTESAISFNEDQPINFNFVVDDLEKDNYKIKIFYNTAAEPATYTEYYPGGSTPTTFAIADNPVNEVHPATNSLPSFTLPFSLVTGAASATITFKVELTDVPESASPITNTFNFPVTVFNVNPPPDVSTATLLPATNTSGIVMEGFPFSFEINEITDDSVGEGSLISWQWMINKNPAECASQTAPSWEVITGAIEGTPTAAPVIGTMTWSPPSLQISSIPSSTTYCFRNCIGDDDFPPINTSNCSPTMAGPWDGGIMGASADRESQLTAPYLQPDDGDTAVWADPLNKGNIYAVHVYQNSIFLMKYIYNADTTITQSGFQFPTKEGSPISATSVEGAYDLSMTGNLNWILISYVYNNPSFFPPYIAIPTNVVVKVSKGAVSATSTAFYSINERVPGGVGQIVADNMVFLVPFINSSIGNTPFYMVGNGSTNATPTTNAAFRDGSGQPLTFSLTEIESRARGSTLYMATKLDDGTVNLYRYILPANSTSSPTGYKVEEDIFFSLYVPFSDMSLAIENPTNQNIFVAGINTNSKTFFYGEKPVSNLEDGNPWTITDLSTNSSATYPQIYDPKGLNAVASIVDGEVLLGFVKEEASLRAPFSDLYILKSNPTGINLSKRINGNRINITFPQQYNSSDFALTNVIPDLVIGNAGAIANENRKDTLWFRYYDFSSDRMVIINTENETFSAAPPVPGSTPTMGSPWSEPWFKN